MDMAGEMARLAAATEELVAMRRADERRRRDERLLEKWGPTLPPMTTPSLGLFMSVVPGLAGLFDRVVPDEFVAQTDVGELTVSCPCGETPAVKAGLMANCGCGRWFLNDGRQVHVAMSPAREGTHAEPA